MSNILFINENKRNQINNYLKSNGQAPFTQSDFDDLKQNEYAHILSPDHIIRGEMAFPPHDEHNCAIAHYLSLESQPSHGPLHVLCLTVNHEPLYFSHISPQGVFRL